MTDAVNWKLGISTCCVGKVDRETFLQYAAGGVEYMEISVGLEQFSEIDWDEIRSLSKETGVKVWSVHLPFMPFKNLNIASFDKDLVEKTLNLYRDAIDRMSEQGFNLAVVHPSGEPNKPEDREALLEIASDALARLAAYAEPKGVTIAVENIPSTCLGNCSNEIKKLISKHPALRVCFDTNHLLDQRNVDFVRDIGEKIVTLHVSDYDFCNERHWLPYEGGVDWAELVTELEKVGYNGVWMYEIGFKAPNNIDRDRDLTFEDFKENYKACINKRPAMPVGTPNHEGCMAWTYYTEPMIK